MNCPRCGADLAQNSAFCNACGSPVTPGQTVPFKRPTVVTVLAVLQFIGAALSLPSAFVALAVGLSYAGGSPTAMPLAFVFVLALLSAAVGLLQLACGIGLLRLRPWGRTLLLVFAWVGLLGFPIGTILSVLILAYFRNPGIKALYSGRARAEMSPEELAQIATVTAGSGAAAVVIVLVVVLGIFALVVIGIAATIVVPLMAPGHLTPANEAAAIAWLRTINMGEARYARECAGGGYAVSLDDLARAPRAGGRAFVLKEVGRDGAVVDGYRFTLARSRADGVADVGTAAATCNASANAPASDYVASAEPVTPGKTGMHYFAADASGNVFVSRRPITNPIRPSAEVQAIR